MTFHIGLIGGGNISETHARAARAISGVEVAAVYGTNSEKARKLCVEHGGSPYTDFAAVFAHRTIDLLLWLLGDVSRVQARVATQLHPIESEDTATAILEFANGAIGVFHATTAAYPGYPRRVEISGTEGTVVLEHDRIIAVDLRNAPAEGAKFAERDENRSGSSAVVSDFRGHQAMIEDFLCAVRKDTTPACDGHEGRRSLALIEAIYAAARTPDRTAGRKNSNFHWDTSQ